MDACMDGWIDGGRAPGGQHAVLGYLLPHVVALELLSSSSSTLQLQCSRSSSHWSRTLLPRWHCRSNNQNTDRCRLQTRYLCFPPGFFTQADYFVHSQVSFCVSRVATIVLFYIQLKGCFLSWMSSWATDVKLWKKQEKKHCRSFGSTPCDFVNISWVFREKGFLLRRYILIHTDANLSAR